MRSVPSLLIIPILFSIASAQDAPPATSPTTQPTSVPFVGPPVIDNTKEIQTILARAVEAGVSKADFDTLVTFVSRPDRDRIGDVRSQTWPNLDGRIDQFRKDWQSKYGQDFKIVDKPSIVFSDKNCAIKLADTDGGDAPATTAPATTRAAAMVKTATVQLPAVRGVPAISLPLVNEGTLVPSWRFDIPDNIDAQRLHDNLLTHLTAFDEDKNSWPSDVTIAYDIVSHHVLAALTGAPVAATQPTTTRESKP